MENPFSELEKRLSGLEKIALESYNQLKGIAGNSHRTDKPLNAQEAAGFLRIPKNTLYALTSRKWNEH